MGMGNIGKKKESANGIISTLLNKVKILKMAGHEIFFPAAEITYINQPSIYCTNTKSVLIKGLPYQMK